MVQMRIKGELRVEPETHFSLETASGAIRLIASNLAGDGQIIASLEVRGGKISLRPETLGSDAARALCLDVHPLTGKIRVF